MNEQPLIAGIQLCSTDDLDVNLDAAATGLRRARDQGAQLAVLPENFACYGGDYRGVAEARGPELEAWLAEQARELGLAIIGGTLPLVARPDGSPVPPPRVRAACRVFDADGTDRARYDKLHLFDAEVADRQGRYCESDVFEPGDRLTTLDLAGLRMGLAVCYDLRFPAHARALVDQGAQVLVYPSAFTEVTGAAHWTLLLRARAVETGCFVLGVDQTGHHGGRRQSHGHSLLANPWGEVEAALDDSTGVLSARVDLARQAEIRHRLPVHQHRRFGVTFPDDIQPH
jgi:predicted amidohydrolase